MNLLNAAETIIKGLSDPAAIGVITGSILAVVGAICLSLEKLTGVITKSITAIKEACKGSKKKK